MDLRGYRIGGDGVGGKGGQACIYSSHEYYALHKDQITAYDVDMYDISSSPFSVVVFV